MNEEWFEVFISGKNFAHSLTRISSKVTRKVTMDTSKITESDDTTEANEHATFFLHKVDLPLVRNAKYTVFTPKLFS